MQDHNLDDLIIDTPHAKESKAKGVLTIIALLIVVLIVAIILTKIILKDPDADNATLNDNTTEMIDPELTLENSADEKAEKDDDQAELSKMIESEIKAPKEEEVKEETVTIEETPKASEASPKPAKPEPVTPTPVPVAKTPVKKEAVPLPKDTYSTPQKAVVKPKKKAVPAVAAGGFYIQVASYQNMPANDSRLIKTLRKYHYSYKIMDEKGMHKVRIGPYKNRASADRAIVRVRDLINKSAFVVKK